MVKSVTIDKFAQCGVTGSPAEIAISTTRNVRLIPPKYKISGCIISTALISIIRLQVGKSQSCSPPVTLICSASVTNLVCSSSQ